MHMHNAKMNLHMEYMSGSKRVNETLQLSETIQG